MYLKITIHIKKTKTNTQTKEKIEESEIYNKKKIVRKRASVNPYRTDAASGDTPTLPGSVGVGGKRVKTELKPRAPSRLRLR